MDRVYTKTITITQLLIVVILVIMDMVYTLHRMLNV